MDANADSSETLPPGKREIVIRPNSGVFDLRLADLWKYRNLILLFVKRDFAAQFKQTILGPAWFVLQPLLTTIVFTVVFGNIAKLSTDGLPKMLFYLSGNVIWGYFSAVLTTTATTFTTNAQLFGKVYFPRLAVPISICISQLIRLGLQIVFLAGFMVYYMAKGAGVAPSPLLIMVVPVLILIECVLALGMGVLFSSLTTKYRDLKFLLTFGVQLMMYATPVIYPLSSLEGHYRTLILANPVTPVVEAFRFVMLGTGTLNPLHLLYSAGCAVVCLFVGVIVFNRTERTFMDTV